MRVAIITTDSREHYRDYDNPAPYFGTAPQALLAGFAQMSGLEVHVLSCTQRRMNSPQKLASNIWFHSLYVPKLGWLRTGYQGCVRVVRRRLQEVKPDVVHGQGTERDCALDAVRSGFPNVLTIHGNMRSLARLNGARLFSFEWLAARLEGFVLSRTDGVVCITRYTQAAVSDLARRTWLLPNAVDASFFEVRQISETVPIVLCVGSICLHKNQNALICALDSLAARMRFRLVFLGGLDATTHYGAQFQKLIADRVWCEFRGFASRGSLKGWLAQTSVLVLPSLEDNCPMVVLEAMAAGVPVAAARIGGVPDLVRDGETGLLCDPRKPEDLRASVERLLIDRHRADKFAERARLEALERFAPERVAAKHVEIYREVLSTRS